MTDKKRPTWEVVNPDGDYVIVRGYREAIEIAKDQNEYIKYELCVTRYWVRRGKPMTDAALKALPALDCF